jgi:opacity protein-like surface antigen
MVGSDAADLANLRKLGMSGKTMKSLARTSKLALLGLTGLLALPASADVGIYGGLQAGYSRTDTNDDVIEFDSDKTYGIYGGYKFLDWLGLEAGYARLGKFDVDSIGGANITSADDQSPVEMNSVYTAVSLWGPLFGPLNAFAKIGAHYSEAKLADDDENGDDGKETSANIYYSIGLEVPIVDFFSVTFAYQNFRNIQILEDSGADDLGDAGVDTYTLGAKFEF